MNTVTRSFGRSTRLLAAAAVILTGTGCEIGPKDSVQTGYRGTGMEDVYDRSDLAKRAAAVAEHIPAPLPPAPGPDGSPSPYKNVQVLTDVSPAEFTRTMLAMSTWVAGTGNCGYCHNLAAPWDDTLANGKPIYTKIVARRMLQMVRDINANYSGHVVNTGVTCYTCHLGKPLPNGLWFYNNPNQVERYFLDREGVRVQTHVVEASNDNRSSVKQTEYTYGVMNRISTSLGVACNHCHNSRAFWSWEQAPPQRVKALLGAQMARHLNKEYLAPLEPVFPASRKGPMGDSPKLQCLTCHNGAYKPLYAYPMAKDYPALWGRTDWNGVPFPTAPGAAPAAASGTTGTAAVVPTAAPAAGEKGTGAMGGQGPAGKDTVKAGKQ